MASSYAVFDTAIDKKFVELFEKQINADSIDLEESIIGNPGSPRNDLNVRSSKHRWISTQHWICGMVWHYVNRANKENFQYDLTGFESEHLQYTVYDEGDFYNWHTDSNLDMLYSPNIVAAPGENLAGQLNTLSGEYVRKLTVSLQLSDDIDYTGGDVQLLTPDRLRYLLPRDIGTITIFDSRISHRVLKIKSGTRKALVGWVCGPRWK